MNRTKNNTHWKTEAKKKKNEKGKTFGKERKTVSVIPKPVNILTGTKSDKDKEHQTKRHLSIKFIFLLT